MYHVCCKSDRNHRLVEKGPGGRDPNRIERANKSLSNVKGAWIQQITVDCEDGRIVEWRANMKVTFVIND